MSPTTASEFLRRAERDAEAALGLMHKLHIGSDLHAPMCFLVHGRQGDFDAMSAFRRCVPAAWQVISLQAPWVDPGGGFSWWDIEIAEREARLASIVEASTLVERFIERSTAYYQLSPQFKAAIGFSQGAALLSLLVQRKPALLTSAALLCGTVIREVAAPAAEIKTRIFVVHGTKDPYFPIEKARHGVQYLRDLKASVTYIEEETRHKVGREGMRALKLWIGGADAC